MSAFFQSAEIFYLLPILSSTYSISHFDFPLFCVNLSPSRYILLLLTLHNLHFSISHLVYPLTPTLSINFPYPLFCRKLVPSRYLNLILLILQFVSIFLYPSLPLFSITKFSIILFVYPLLSLYLALLISHLDASSSLCLTLPIPCFYPEYHF